MYLTSSFSSTSFPWIINKWPTGALLFMAVIDNTSITDHLRALWSSYIEPTLPSHCQKASYHQHGQNRHNVHNEESRDTMNNALWKSSCAACVMLYEASNGEEIAAMEECVSDLIILLKPKSRGDVTEVPEQGRKLHPLLYHVFDYIGDHRCSN